jgi:hypothetical protein
MASVHVRKNNAEFSRMDLFNLKDIYLDSYQDILSLYQSETKQFLYSHKFLLKNRRLKMSLITTTVRYDLVRKDFLYTLFNGLKTFSQINSHLMRETRNAIDSKPLTAYSLAKLKHKDLFLFYSYFIFWSASTILYRNIKFIIENGIMIEYLTLLS